MGRIINKGLVFPTSRWEIEDVTARHKTPCCVCKKMPRERRLKITVGSGRSAYTLIRCRACGFERMRRLSQVLGRAMNYISSGDYDSVRDRTDDDPKPVREKAKPKRKDWIE